MPVWSFPREVTVAPVAVGRLQLAGAEQLPAHLRARGARLPHADTGQIRQDQRLHRGAPCQRSPQLDHLVGSREAAARHLRDYFAATLLERFFWCTFIPLGADCHSHELPLVQLLVAW